jgi:hypothetical protein
VAADAFYRLTGLFSLNALDSSFPSLIKKTAALLQSGRFSAAIWFEEGPNKANCNRNDLGDYLGQRFI